VLFVSAEAAPFAKVGGLADVAGSLPKALRQIGVDVRVMMPLYGFLDVQRYDIQPLFSFELHRATGMTTIEVLRADYDTVPVYFIRAWPFFGEETVVYGDWEVDCPRFIFFNQAAVALADELRRREDWFPDVFHVNDWHTGLIPFLLETKRGEPGWETVGSMLSIHNMAYQGDNVGGWFWEQQIPAREHPELTSRNLTNNMLAIAIAHSDIVSTVSPRYSIEIQYPYMGYGLDGLLRTRIRDLHGILNGIDLDQWNPETDPLLIENFNADNFQEKRIANKRQLQADAGLEVRDDVPVISLVSRLVFQKGIDIALPALRRLLLDTDIQFIALGTGEQALNDQLYRLGQDFHWRASVFLGYNATVAQRIYGGADLFLMPSRYEPCGVGQMLAMRYGTLPLVRETGGLADTVDNYDNGPADRGTGFMFLFEEPDALLNTMRWALNTYWERRDAWLRMQRRAMLVDFSWDRSARQYADLYARANAQRKG
jgi:starch synthase